MIARRSNAPVKGNWLLETLVNPARGKSTMESPMLPSASFPWRDNWSCNHSLSRASSTLDNSSSFLSSLCDLLKVSTTRLASIKKSVIPNSTRKTAVSGGLPPNRSAATFPQTRRERRAVEVSNTSRFLASIVPASPVGTIRETTRMFWFRSAFLAVPIQRLGVILDSYWWSYSSRLP